jgi:IMP dehydrogenase/GMP reductase
VPTVAVAIILLAIGALTVISRQTAKVKASGVPEKGVAPMASSNADKRFVTMEVAGQKVLVDPQTGRVQDLTPEEAQRLARGLKGMVNKSSADLEEVHHKDGSASLNLEGRFQSVTVAKVDEDGNLVTSCVDTPRAAGAFFGIDPQLIREGGSEDPRNPTEVTPAKTQN